MRGCRPFQRLVRCPMRFALPTAPEHSSVVHSQWSAEHLNQAHPPRGQVHASPFPRHSLQCVSCRRCHARYVPVCSRRQFYQSGNVEFAKAGHRRRSAEDRNQIRVRHNPRHAQNLIPMGSIVTTRPLGLCPAMPGRSRQLRRNPASLVDPRLLSAQTAIAARFPRAAAEAPHRVSG